MLLGQDRGRHQIDHLTALLDCLKRGPDGNLRLAVAHVPADQPVHDLRAFHVIFGILDGLDLILRLLKGKHLFEFLLPHRICPVDIAVRLLPRRIELYQILCDDLNRGTDLLLRLYPLAGAQLVQLRLCSIRAGILLDQVQLGCRDIQDASLCIGDLHIILGHLLHLDLLNSMVNAQPMILMYHIIPGL